MMNIMTVISAQMEKHWHTAQQIVMVTESIRVAEKSVKAVPICHNVQQAGTM